MHDGFAVPHHYNNYNIKLKNEITGMTESLLKVEQNWTFTSKPLSHFQSYYDPGLSTLQHHSAWLDVIRHNICYHIKYENETIPSIEALLLHWKRTCWVTEMWGQATCSKMTLEPMTNYGWSFHDNTLSKMWDSHDNIAAVCERTNVLLKG